MMENNNFSKSDYGLIYLSNFENGLSYYKWNQDVISLLKSRLHPNEILTDLKSKEFIKSIDYEGVKHYALTEIGLKHAQQIRIEIEPFFSRLTEVQNVLRQKGYLLEEIKTYLPVSSFIHSNRKYRFLLDVDSNCRYVLRVILPSDTNKAFNEVEMSVESLLKTSYLEGLLVADFKLFDDQS